jgi:hypothetical protein
MGGNIVAGERRSGDKPGLPDRGITMPVEDAQHSHFCFADYIEHAVGKEAQQGPAHFTVNLGIPGWVLSDSLQTIIERTAEL